MTTLLLRPKNERSPCMMVERVLSVEGQTIDIVRREDLERQVDSFLCSVVDGSVVTPTKTKCSLSD